MAFDKDQLDIATKMNAVVDSMAKNMARLEQSYETQITAVQKLADIVKQVDTQRARQELSALNDVKLDKLKKGLDDTGEASGGMSEKLKTAAATLQKKLPIALGTSVGALDGFLQGIRNVVALTKGVGSFTASVADGLFSITAAIIAVPFKLFNNLVDLAASSAGGSTELAQAIENLRKAFGALTGPTPHAVFAMTKTLKGFSDTGLSAFRVFGTLAERIEAFTKLAEAMGATFQRLTKEFEANGGAILAYQKGLGISDEQMGSFAQRALAQGSDISSVLKDTAKYALELGKAFGVDSKVISKDMAKAMADVKHFAGATTKQIGEAATYARKLGVELDKIVGTLDAFETFDTAAENVAKLSQSFGVTVDAFKLMQAQSPAEQVDTLRKAFLAAGKSADTMSRQELKLLSQTTGLDEATARLAFSSKNQALSLDEIKKKGGEAEKKTLTQAQAMSKLADSIERLVKSGMTQTGGFFDMFVKGILAGLQSTEDFRAMIWEIKRGLQQVFMIGVQLGRALPKLIPDLGTFLHGLREFFDPKKFTKLFGGVKEAITWFLKDKDASMQGVMERLRKNFFDFFDSEEPAARKILDSFKSMFKKMAALMGEGIKWASAQVADGLRSIASFIRDPKKFLDEAQAAGTGAASFIIDALKPLAEGIRDAWTVLYPAARELLGVLWDKVTTYVKSPEFYELVRPTFLPLAAVLFGPAVGQAVVGTLTTMLIKSIGSALGGQAVTSAAAAGGTAVGGIAGAAMVAAAAAGIAADAYLIYKAFDELSKGLEDRNDTVMKGVQERNKLAAEGNVEALKNAYLTAQRAASSAGEAIDKQQQKLYETQIAQAESVQRANKEAQEITDKIDKAIGKSAAKAQEDAGSAAADAIDKANKTIADKLKARFDMTKGSIAGDPKEFVSSTNAIAQDLSKLKDTVGKIDVDDINKQLSKLKDIKFDVLTTFSEDAKNIPKVLAVLQGTQETLSVIGDLPKTISKVTAAVRADAIKPALEAVQQMVKMVNDLNSALSDGDLNKLNVVAKLQNVAKSVGLGAKANYTIKNKDVVVNIDLKVVMNVDEVEKVMILRKNSFVRDRINVALDAAGVKGGDLPDNRDSPVVVPFSAPKG